MNINIEDQIDYRLKFIPRNPISYYISEQSRKFKPSNFSIRIPIYRDGKRTSLYLGSYDSFDDAVSARDYALKQIEKSDRISLTIPLELSKFGRKRGI
mgnify:CR=1 FL=1